MRQEKKLTNNLNDAEYIQKYGAKLSPATKRSKWINSPDQHEDQPGQSLATRSHEVIKAWVEERKATPATVPGTKHDSHLGVLQFDFPGFGGENLEPVSWEEWFKTFDMRELVFIFQEHMRSGRLSNFFHLDSPFREHD